MTHHSPDPMFALLKRLLALQEHVRTMDRALHRVIEDYLDHYVTGALRAARDEAEAGILAHAMDPMPNASLHDEPPSAPIV